MMMHRMIIAVVLVGFVSSLSSLSELKELFTDDYTSVFKMDGVFGKDLELKVKKIYRGFLENASLAQKNRINSYFEEWRRVVDINGPFETDAKRDNALKTIMNPSDFHAALYVEQLLQNRDDSEKAISAFKKAMISSDTMKLQLYFTGDGDIINGVIVASLKNNGHLYVLTSIFD